MNWKKTFEVSILFNILFVALSILTILTPKMVFFLYYGNNLLIEMSYVAASIMLLFFPLMVYFGYKSKKKLEITLKELFKLLIPLFVFFLIVSYLSVSIDVFSQIIMFFEGGWIFLVISFIPFVASIIISFLGCYIGYIIAIKAKR